jgi:hypothetical protein
LSPAVNIVCDLKSFGLDDLKVLELVLLGGYQTSWSRFYHVGRIILRNVRLLQDPFRSYITLADDIFLTLGSGPACGPEPSGGSQPCVPSVTDFKRLYYSNNFELKGKVIEVILNLLNWLNECPEESFLPILLRDKLAVTAAAIRAFQPGTELDKSRLMVIVQICAILSCIVVQSF